jgi:hypothetical protein
MQYEVEMQREVRIKRTQSATVTVDAEGEEDARWEAAHEIVFMYDDDWETNEDVEEDDPEVLGVECLEQSQIHPDAEPEGKPLTVKDAIDLLTRIRDGSPDGGDKPLAMVDDLAVVRIEAHETNGVVYVSDM